MEETLNLSVEICKSGFNLENVVCNHGFFMMAPNEWIPSTKTLRRPLRISEQSKTVIVSISHPSPPNLLVSVTLRNSASALSPAEKDEILKQVSRMLRITEKDERAIEQFHQLHPQAKEKAFGRLFRSPSPFEDAVKCLLLCNCTWSKTLKMAKSMCEIPFKLRHNSDNFTSNSAKLDKKRKRRQKKVTIEDEFDELRSLGNFPSSKELASFNEDDLRKYCGLGYRAKNIIQLVQKIEQGTLNLNEIEQKCEFWPYKKTYDKLYKIKGFGDFATTTLLMCLGSYQKVPADTETTRHLKEVHGRTDNDTSTTTKIAEEIYDKYEPFQCTAYWFELVEYYEKKHGKLSMLCKSDYHKVTGRS